MNDLNHCYRILGLAQGASLSEIKTAYRHLARRYHPDTCADELRSQAQHQFIQINHAYEQLLKTWPTPAFAPNSDINPVASTPSPPPQPTVSPIRQQQDAQLKQQSYQQLHGLLQAQRFARAIALIEGLALRLPQDPEVRQWQAIAYFQWGKRLVAQRQWGKAKVYLRKAIRTDPHNQELFSAVEQHLQQLQHRASF